MIHPELFWMCLTFFFAYWALFFFCAWWYVKPHPPASEPPVPAPALDPAVMPPPLRKKDYPSGRKDHVSVMGSASSTARTTAHIINNPDVWQLLVEGVYLSPHAATRADFCKRTNMPQPRWSVAHKWLVERSIIDERNQLLVDKRLIKHGELVN